MSALNWVIVALVFGAVEVFTTGFWFLWLSLSAFIIAFATQIGWMDNLNFQLLMFSCFTLLFLFFTRPIVVRFIKSNDTPSNVNALVGQKGKVIEPIDPLHYGQVKVNGEVWTAMSTEQIEADTHIIVTGIDGVKLVVTRHSID